MFESQFANKLIIPEGEVSKIVDSNNNLIWQKCDYVYTPYNANKSDAIAVQAINVSANDVITIYYYLTSTSGVIFDASNCGGAQTSASSGTANTHMAKTFTASKSGKLIIGGTYTYYNWGMDWPGSLGMNPPYAKYIKVKIN